jgi:hypothetical protein
MKKLVRGTSLPDGRVAPGRAPADEGVQARFDAFISYSHEDSALADAIQRGLHKLAKPLWRPRSLRVFLDRTDLAANPELWARITTALGASAF